jgi:hypothetical protein
MDSRTQNAVAIRGPVTGGEMRPEKAKAAVDRRFPGYGRGMEADRRPQNDPPVPTQEQGSTTAAEHA